MVGEMAILDTSGDTKIMWDSNNSDEVEAARDTFNKLKKKGYIAFSVEGKEANKGKQVKDFDPKIERLIMAPAIGGG